MLRKSVKEEYAIVLDFLPNGHPFDARPAHIKTPIAQAIGKDHFILLELVPKKDVFLQPLEEVYTGEGKREKIHHIYGKINYEKLTHTARSELDHVVKELIKKHEPRFIEFFNKAGPINMRRHQIELLPGIGKKHMMELLEQRQEKFFENFEDIRKRVKLLPDPEKIVIRRIISELKGEDKYKVFVEN
ncbi:DUF655 domain-containing protein [Candidatus Woesearchaeota archaeon]|nr:DUF655 domain-containing protein [Candidatus Woesearchaeota archaeon]